MTSVFKKSTVTNYSNALHLLNSDGRSRQSGNIVFYVSCQFYRAHR